MVHGLGEHLGRYQYLKEWLLQEGYHCYQYDQRGHGLSGGKRGDVVSFHDYASDLNLIYEMAKSDYHDLPIYVFGHSMGSLVVLLNLILYTNQWQGAILSGVPLEITRPIPKWEEFLATKAARVVPWFPISSDIDSAYLSHDTAVTSAYLTDPLVNHRVTVRWAVAFLTAIQEVKARLAEITENLLILHGEKDQISKVEGARLLAETLGSQQTQLIVYPGLYHEIHNEREADRNREFQDIGHWLTR